MNNEVLQAVQQMIGGIIGTLPVIGSMPPNEGFAVSFVGGSPSGTYRALDKAITLPVLFNGKSEDQEALSAAMNAAHQALTTSKTLPYADGWQIYAIRTTSFPNLIGREQNKNWVYGSSFAVDYYAKGASL